MKIFERLLHKEISKALGTPEGGEKKIIVHDDLIEHAENEIKEAAETKKRLAYQLRSVVQNSDLTEIKEYFENNIIYKWLVDIPDEKGLNALLIASHRGLLEIVEALLDSGANVNYKTEKGYTALMFAAVGGHLTVVETLIKNGAVITSTVDGISPLDFAREGKHDEVERFLLKVSPSEEAWKYLANAKAKLTSDSAGAIVDFTKAITLDSKLVEAYYYRGVLKCRTGDPNGGIQDFNKAIELKSDFAEAFTYRGIAKQVAGDNLGACKDWEKATGLGDEKAQNLIQIHCKK